jgi:hypothetical protein
MLHGEGDLAKTKRVLRSHVDAMNGGPTTIALADDPIDLPYETIQLGEKPYESLRAVAPDLHREVARGNLDAETAYTIALERT